MTADQLEREQSYRVAMALAGELFRDGVIDEVALLQVDKIMLARFQPILAGLCPENNLIQSEHRGNM